MRDDICTIPVSEVFEPKDGCPLCRMRNTAERRVIEYIMGAAMMEPDVRIKTNELGFCNCHFEMLSKERGRLSLALMLDSHLAEIEKNLFAPEKAAFLRPNPKKQLYRAARLNETCFVCDKMDYGMSRMLDTLYRIYNKEKSFRALFSEQPQFCLPHYQLLMENAPGKLDKGLLYEFQKTAAEITKNYLLQLGSDIRHFCSMFDYRNNSEDADWGNSKDSIERTIAFLTSRESR